MHEAQHSTFRDWLDLVRLPNLFIATADILAGFFFAGGLPGEWFVLLRLILASMCLYAGGVALNDVVDVEQDLRERPHRPIPSERISGATALRFVFASLGCGVLLAATVSAQALLVSLALCISIFSYNFLKQTPVAPPIMGLCRALNLLLGMHGLDTLLPLPAVRPMTAVFVYVAAVTYFGRKEARGGSRIQLLAGLAGIVAAVGMLRGFRWYGYNARHVEYLVVVGPMMALVLIVGLHAVWRPTGPNVQRAVKIFVMGIVAVDACIAWVAAGPVAASAVAAMLFPCILLARTLRVT